MKKIRNNLKEFKEELKEEFMFSAYLFNLIDWTDSIDFKEVKKDSLIQKLKRFKDDIMENANIKLKEWKRNK